MPTTVQPIEVAPKDPDVAITYDLDLFENLVPDTLRSNEYEAGDVTRPHRDNGFYFECQTAGRTGIYNPYSPRQANQQIRDGSVVWVSKHPSDVTVPEISSVVWSAGDLTVDSQSEAGHIASVTLSGGEDGVDYEVTARVTPSVGNPRDITIVVPVREL